MTHAYHKTEVPVHVLQVSFARPRVISPTVIPPQHFICDIGIIVERDLQQVYEFPLSEKYKHVHQRMLGMCPFEQHVILM